MFTPAAFSAKYNAAADNTSGCAAAMSFGTGDCGTFRAGRPGGGGGRAGGPGGFRVLVPGAVVERGGGHGPGAKRPAPSARGPSARRQGRSPSKMLLLRISGFGARAWALTAGPGVWRHWRQGRSPMATWARAQTPLAFWAGVSCVFRKSGYNLRTKSHHGEPLRTVAMPARQS